MRLFHDLLVRCPASSGFDGLTWDTLTAFSFANGTSGVTWGGQTYETSDGKVQGTPNVTTVPVEDGVVIHDTEAILLTFS